MGQSEEDPSWPTAWDPMPRIGRHPRGGHYGPVVSAHVVAIVGQPVFAGTYLTGDFDSLRWHAVGADVVTSIGYTQVIVAIVVWSCCSSPSGANPCRGDRGRPAMRESMTRWQVLGIGGALGLMAATGLSASAALARRPSITGAESRSALPLPPPFQVPLPIPSVLAPVSTSGGADRYAITQREASVEILPGVRTPLWTYEGTFPGPTIESRRGRPVTVTHRNAGRRPPCTRGTACTIHVRW
jgi:hypothetical protein